jgi:hypothetical protein
MLIVFVGVLIAALWLQCQPIHTEREMQEYAEWWAAALASKPSTTIQDKAEGEV